MAVRGREVGLGSFAHDDMRSHEGDDCADEELARSSWAASEGGAAMTMPAADGIETPSPGSFTGVV